MTFFQAFILGIVEGITEFLPISSTAHLEITARLLQIQESIFLTSFIISIQLGAICAVSVLYFNLLKKNSAIWKRIITAFIPTGIIGFVVYKLLKEYVFGNISVIAGALLIGGLVLIVFEYVYKQGTAQESEHSMRELEKMPYKHAFIIGIAQALAVIPGVSRSAATIIAGRMLGVRKYVIVEFSFLLAIPTMLAATGYDVLKNSSAFSASNMSVLCVGFIIAFISALLSVKFLLAFIKQRSLVSFGVYRIILAILLLLFLL